MAASRMNEEADSSEARSASRIQRLVRDKTDVLDYADLVTKQPWLVTERQDCVLSPDSDGLLCGLFMAHYLGWRVVGFYDGKVLLLKSGISAKSPNTIFLDVDIYRREVRSVGHHMVLFNKRTVPANWSNFDNCVQPNNLRGYDRQNDFRIKYPLATIHLLLGILGSTRRLTLPDGAIAPLLFTDGTFQNLYLYPENVLHWLDYLGVREASNPLRQIFLSERHTVYSLMVEMDQFFRRRDAISIARERGDRLRISTNTGDPCNIVRGAMEGTFSLQPEAIGRMERFVALLAETTGWTYDSGSWDIHDLRLYQFTKSSFSAQGWTQSNRDFAKFIAKNPLSWAIRSNTEIEFTFETPDKLP